MNKHVLNLLIILCVSAGIALLGCGQSTVQVPEPPKPPDNEWEDVDILTPPASGTDGFLYALGIAESTDLSISLDRAKQAAREAIAFETEATIKALAENFRQSLGPGASARINSAFTQVSEGIAFQTLIGARTHETDTKRSKKTGVYRAQVIMAIPIGENLDAPLDKIIGEEEAEKQEFAAWKGHQRLDKKIKELSEAQGGHFTQPRRFGSLSTPSGSGQTQ